MATSAKASRTEARATHSSASIAARGSRARVVAARHVYFVDPMPGAHPDLAKLGAILRGTPADAAATAASVRLAVPRLGTISPWASKATEILLGCGLPVHRVERGVEYVVEALDDEAAVAAELHDPMTQTLLRERLRTCRDRLVAGLQRLPGVEVASPPGGLYAFFRVDGEPDSLAFAKRLVAEQGLGIAPGAAFGPEGEGWLRWCFASRDPARLADGLARLGAALRL